MKKVLLGLGGLLALVVMAFGIMMGSVFGGLKEMPDGQELPGGSKRINHGYTSAYLIPISAEHFALIDCADEAEATAIKAELTKRGFGVAAVKAIFLTHGHPDHTGGCKQFPQATVYVGEGEQAIVQGKEATKGPLPGMMGIQKEFALSDVKPLKDGETVEIENLKVRAFVIPGHTAGSAAYLTGGALYMGDSLTFNTDGTVRKAPWLFSDDGAVNVASLKRLGKLLEPEAGEVKAVVPSHSGSVDSLKSLVEFAGT
jgi:glyoxylase-like metal-dependent hydrolase (beta-lactamase superfamily II)